MDSEKTDRLSTEQAKLRLRQAIDDVGLHALVKRHPYEVLAAGFTAGVVLAMSKPMRGAMLRMLLRII